MEPIRIVAVALLVASSACDDEKPADPVAQAKQELADDQAKAACTEVFAKVESCRDDLLMLARTGPVVRGDAPESAFAAAKRLADSMSGDLSAQCNQGAPADLEKAVKCFDDDCRTLATCMIGTLTYPPLASGDGALQCRDGLPALEAKGQGKVLQWCVMPDGTPHGLFVLKDDAGTVLVEGAYDRGLRQRGGATPMPGMKWWD